jgi:hypothetical protein
VPSSSHEPPGPESRTQQPATSQEATADPAYKFERISETQLADKLRGFAESTMLEFSEAQIDMIDRIHEKGCHNVEWRKWCSKAYSQGNIDVIL